MAALQDSLVLLPSPTEAPGFRLARSTSAVYSVRLWGPLAPAWTGHFTLGLFHTGINILRGFARQDGEGRWVADFLIAPTDASPDLTTVDYLDLAMREQPAADAVPVSLTHYTLDGSPDQGAALYLEVRGPDRVGFLGSLLRALEDLSLSPRDMTIMTRDREVFDCFWLKTVEGRVPSDEDRRALAGRLDALLVRG
jgi:hypothetical protein